MKFRYKNGSWQSFDIPRSLYLQEFHGGFQVTSPVTGDLFRILLPLGFYKSSKRNFRVDVALVIQTSTLKLQLREAKINNVKVGDWVAMNIARRLLGNIHFRNEIKNEGRENDLEMKLKKDLRNGGNLPTWHTLNTYII